MFDYKQFLTISLIVMSLTIMSSIVYASLPEHIQSPRQQMESGIMPNEITCRDDLIPVIRNNGNVAYTILDIIVNDITIKEIVRNCL